MWDTNNESKSGRVSPSLKPKVQPPGILTLKPGGILRGAGKSWLDAFMNHANQATKGGHCHD
jgi:hypothetical protein